MVHRFKCRENDLFREVLGSLIYLFNYFILLFQLPSNDQKIFDAIINTSREDRLFHSIICCHVKLKQRTQKKYKKYNEVHQFILTTCNISQKLKSACFF